MLFNSLEFLLFAVLFFSAYFFLKGGIRLWFLLGSSYVFYCFWDWRFAGLIFISSLVDFQAGRGVDGAKSKAGRQGWLWASLGVNLGILCVFKYLNFFIGSTVELLESIGFTAHHSTLQIILPLGISFYTFQSMSYTLDIYAGRIKPEKSLLRFCVFVALFPQLVAGPIVRARKFLPQLGVDAAFHARRFVTGLEYIVWGYFLKLCVADNLAMYIDPRFDHFSNYGGGVMGLTFVAFSFQIYCDFAGYSLIAIGLGRMMGFDFGVNFRRPYFAAGFGEFWKRWHISMSSWFRDYVYIPLGGNRLGRGRAMACIFITMAIAGLWHGAAWGFVLWGLLHAVFQCVEKTVCGKSDSQLQAQTGVISKGIWISVVFVCVTLAWIPFRIPDIVSCIKIYEHAFMNPFDFSGIIAYWNFLFAGGIGVLLVVVVDWASERPRRLMFLRRSPWLRGLAFAGLANTILFLGKLDGRPFIYFVF